MKNTDGLKAHAENKRKASLDKVNSAIKRLIASKGRINFNTVSTEADVSKAYLYNSPSLRQRIESLRKQQINIQPQQVKHNMTESSKDVLIAAKNKLIKELQNENKQLKQELAKALGEKYEAL